MNVKKKYKNKNFNKTHNKARVLQLNGCPDLSGGFSWSLLVLGLDLGGNVWVAAVEAERE